MQQMELNVSDAPNSSQCSVCFLVWTWQSQQPRRTRPKVTLLWGGCPTLATQLCRYGGALTAPRNTTKEKGRRGLTKWVWLTEKKERKTQGKEKSEHSADLRRFGRKVEKESYKCVISISMFTFVSSFYVTSLHEYGWGCQCTSEAVNVLLLY